MELKVSIKTKGKIFEGKPPEIIREQLEGFMYEGTSYLERLVKKHTPIGVYGAKGGLVSTIHGEVIGKGISIIKGIVGEGSPYGEVIEKGRTAGKKWPPEGTLLRWIEVKLGVDEIQAKKLEFIIRRKIGKKGFPGAHMFEKGLEEGFPGLIQMADRHGFEITRELNQ